MGATLMLISSENMKRKNKNRMFKRTFLHGDFHVENIFFDVVGKDGKKSPRIIDYQLVIEGDGCRDVVYYNVFNLKPDIRQKHEKQIIELYYKEMHENGATDFSMTECLLSYIISYMFPVPITAITQKDSTGGDSEEGKKKIKLYMTRTNQAIKDWNCVNTMKLVLEKSPNG